jgi:hypothetical protein
MQTSAMTRFNRQPTTNKRPHRPHRLLAIVALTLAWATSASAFPNWVGVYGDVQRQSGGNPGTFTILTNDDYWGLHASVGIQVNGGPWTVHLMNYSGRKDGNSKWTFTPGAFPTGASVNYYFYIWDNTGAGLWDSNGGANYSFVAAPPAATQIPGDLNVVGAVRFLPRGDIPMGQFTSGPQP